jgi:hypothetical protein
MKTNGGKQSLLWLVGEQSERRQAVYIEQSEDEKNY